MPRAHWFVAAAGLTALSLLAGWAQPEAKKDAAPAAQPEAQPDAAAEAAWMEFMTPGKEHEILARFAGKWACKTTMWMDPAAEPMVSDGKMECEMVLGGRYLRQAYKGEMMGMPFEGFGYWGFNNKTKKYEGSWMDTFGTSITNSIGSGTAERIEMIMEMTDPISGGTMKQKEVIEWVDANTAKNTFFMIEADGKEFKHMEIILTRAAAAGPAAPKAPKAPATAPHGS